MTTVTVNLRVQENRQFRPYSRREYLGRILWALVLPLFRYSPRPLFGWRRWLLRLFGARVGRNVHVYPSATIYLPWMLRVGDDSSIGEWALIYNLGLVTIGQQATVSHRAHVCAGTHAYQSPTLELQRVPVVIEDRVWVCADALVGPGVRVGEGAVVAAGAVVSKDVPAWQVVGGNPARVIKARVMKS